jgi:hypothetical protein
MEYAPVIELIGGQCLSCLRGFPDECRGGGCNGMERRPESETSNTGTTEDLSSEHTHNDEGEGDEDQIKAAKRERRTKPDSALKDQQSTGRKRAARLYPLNPNEECEWRFKSGMGGGANPIQGCPDGKQQARHHGPDKNTLNNEPGNVHRICHRCHNTWHAKNDPDYDPNKPLKD